MGSTQEENREHFDLIYIEVLDYTVPSFKFPHSFTRPKQSYEPTVTGFRIALAFPSSKYEIHEKGPPLILEIPYYRNLHFIKAF